MKKSLLLSFTLLAAFFTFSIFSCKKKSTGTSCTTLIVKDSSVSNSTTTVRTFKYNTDKKLVKVTYSYKNGNNTSTEFDTIMYSTPTQISMVKRYRYTGGIPTVFETNTYTYTGGVITNVNEVGINTNGAYNRNRVFTYTNNVISDMTVTYNSGSNSGEPLHIRNIVVRNGNLASGFLVDESADITIETSLTAPNPYYGLFFESRNFLDFFCQNNVTAIYPTSMPNNKIEDNSYTYSSGRVATITRSGGGGTMVTTVFYDCL